MNENFALSATIKWSRYEVSQVVSQISRNLHQFFAALRQSQANINKPRKQNKSRPRFFLCMLSN